MNAETPEPPGTLEANGDEPREADWTEALGLPCRMRFGFTIEGFSVGQLLGLEIGSVIDSGQPEGSPVRVELNGRPIGNAEIEALDGKLGFRVTELD